MTQSVKWNLVVNSISVTHYSDHFISFLQNPNLTILDYKNSETKFWLTAEICLSSYSSRHPTSSMTMSVLKPVCHGLFDTWRNTSPLSILQHLWVILWPFITTFITIVLLSSLLVINAWYFLVTSYAMINYYRMYSIPQMGSASSSPFIWLSLLKLWAALQFLQLEDLCQVVLRLETQQVKDTSNL